MSTTSIKYYTYPRTTRPPKHADDIAHVFEKHEESIGTAQHENGLKSDDVLDTIRDDLVSLGFDIEDGKRKGGQISRPVLFGENGEPELNYYVDGYHPDWEYGLEVEAGRAWKGNAIYRDLIQALVMV